jgi:hypothetical protein
LKKSDSEKARVLLEFIDTGVEYNKEKKGEKIVNEYGQAIMAASELNKRKVQNFTKNLNSASVKALNERQAIYHHLQNKFDMHLLSHDKEIIREALEVLLKDEIDSHKIEQLRTGLLLLDDFIDYSKFES